MLREMFKNLLPCAIVAVSSLSFATMALAADPAKKGVEGAEVYSSEVHQAPQLGEVGTPPYRALPPDIEANAAFTGQCGVIYTVARNGAPVSGIGGLRVKNSVTGNSVHLLTALTYFSSGEVQVPGKWPRAHKGWIFKVDADPSQYPQYVFVAATDAAHVAGDYRYPVASFRAGRWVSLGLMAKDPLEMGSPITTLSVVTKANEAVQYAAE